MNHPSVEALNVRVVEGDSATSLQDVVTRRIRESILRQDLKPGTPLIQLALADALGVSRQPVREALRRLESEGLVVRSTAGSLLVRPVDDAELEDTYRYRILLEPEAARRAAENVAPTDIIELKRLNAYMEQASAEGERALFVELNTEFHKVIHRATGSKVLQRLVGQLWVGWGVSSPLYVPGAIQRSSEQHRMLIEAIELGNSDEASSIMLQHVTDARQAYLKGS